MSLTSCNGILWFDQICGFSRCKFSIIESWFVYSKNGIVWQARSAILPHLLHHHKSWVRRCHSNVKFVNDFIKGSTNLFKILRLECLLLDFKSWYLQSLHLYHIIFKNNKLRVEDFHQVQKFFHKVHCQISNDVHMDQFFFIWELFTIGGSYCKIVGFTILCTFGEHA